MARSLDCETGLHLNPGHSLYSFRHFLYEYLEDQQRHVGTLLGGINVGREIQPWTGISAGEHACSLVYRGAGHSALSQEFSRC